LPKATRTMLLDATPTRVKISVGPAERIPNPGRPGATRLSARTARLTKALDYSHYATMVSSSSGVEWTLLAYRVPREPSTPRIAVWRKLKKLGVAQIGEGLVALPADARTTEALEWVADDVLDAGGAATIWQARLTSRTSERELIASLAAARSAEYQALADRAEAALAATMPSHAEGMRRLRPLRRELRAIQRRDFFPPPARQRAQEALKTLAAHVRQTQSSSNPEPEVSAPWSG
jgi:hypothetical protein